MREKSRSKERDKRGRGREGEEIERGGEEDRGIDRYIGEKECMFWWLFKDTKGDRDIDGRQREGRRERWREGGRDKEIDKYGVIEDVCLGG